MNTIKIDNGLQEYQLAEGCIVKFNPSDTVFLRKLYDMFNEAGKKQEAYHAELAKISPDDTEALLNFMDREDAAMREKLDAVFGVPVCKPVFGDITVYARNKDGLPLWAHLLLAVMDQCDADVGELTERERKTIDKYTKKYMKRK